MSHPWPEYRLAAAYVAAERRLPVADELIEMLRDPDSRVVQQARRSLKYLSYYADAARKSGTPGVKPAAVDYGPPMLGNRYDLMTAQEKWSAWAADNRQTLLALHRTPAVTQPVSVGK